ncbi:MAG TPA: hypothetical protein PKD00_03125 [Burkholderiales bacterium]|nr:hypothetical protein [Burkholderiales bacterium]
MKKTTTTKTIKVDKYHLTNEVKYDITFVNGKETHRDLFYVGKNINDYPLKPIYKEDISLLKSWNPFWGDKNGKDKGYAWINNLNLPEPEKINMNNIILVQNATHSFYDISKEPIPVVVMGDYIEAKLRSNVYDLVKLREHFLKHPNVVSCTEIEEIPYYNNDSGYETYFTAMIYPEKSWLIEMLKDKRGLRQVFYHYSNVNIDYLGMKPFLKK